MTVWAVDGVDFQASLNVVSVAYLASTDPRNDVDHGAAKMKIALWQTWSNWSDSMVDMGIVGSQLC
jgi:hypothetical protein